MHSVFPRGCDSHLSIVRYAGTARDNIVGRPVQVLYLEGQRDGYPEGAGWPSGISSASRECKEFADGLTDIQIVYKELGNHGIGPPVAPEKLKPADLRRRAELDIGRLRWISIDERANVGGRLPNYAEPLIIGGGMLTRMRRCGIRALPLGCPHGHHFGGQITLMYGPAVQSLHILAGDKVAAMQKESRLPESDRADAEYFLRKVPPKSWATRIISF